MAGKLYQSGIVISGDASKGVRVLRLTQEELKRLDSTMGTARRSAHNMNQGMGQLQRGMRGSLSILRQLTPAFGAFGAAFAVREMIDAGLAMDGYNRALQAVLGTAELATEELSFIRQEADRVGVAFEPVVKEYAKLAAAARNTALEGQFVRDIFTAVIEVSRTLNLTTEDTRGAIFALQQMISKGRVSAEELRRQLGERIPGAFKAMADAAGVSAAELDDMLKKGELLSEDVLPAFAEQLRKMAKDGLQVAQNSPAAEFNRMANALFDFNVEASKDLLPLLAEGAKLATVGLEAMSGELDTLLTIILGFTAARFLGPLILSVGQAALTTVKSVQLFGVGLTALNAKAALASGGMGALGKAMRFLGGPAGVGIAALAGVVAVVQSATEEIRELEEESTAAAAEMARSFEHLGDVREAAELDRKLSFITPEEAEEQIQLIDRTIRGLQNRLEQLQFPFNNARELIKPTEEDLRQWELLEQMLDAYTVTLARYREHADPAAAAAQNLNEKFAELIEPLQKKAGALDKTEEAIRKQAEAMIASGDITEENRRQYEEFIRKLDEAAAAEEREKKAKEASTEAAREQERALKAAQKALETYTEATNPAAAAAHELGQTAADLTRWADENGVSHDVLAKIIDDLRKQYEALLTPEERHLVNLEKLNDTTQERLDELRLENEAMALSIARHEDLAVAKLIVQGADQAVIDAMREELALHEELSEVMAQQKREAETWFKALERGIERLDDAFAGFWKTLLSDGKFSFDTLKTLAINTIAEIIHALTTRRLGVGILNALGLSPAAGTGGLGTAAVGVAGSFLPSWLAGQSQSPGGGFSLAGISNFFGGNSFGSFLSNLPPWLGGSTGVGQFGPNYGISQGGLFGNAGNVANWQYGLAGLAGGFFGDMLFGGYGGAGGSLGATLGLAISGGNPLGAIIGGLVLGAFGGLFGGGGVPDLYAASSRGNIPMNPIEIDSPLGPTFIGHDDFDDDLLPDIIRSIQQFDQAIASILSEDNLALVTEALKDWRVDMEGEAISMEALLRSRFNAILSAFDDDVQAFVRGVSDIEGQAERLAQALTAQNIIEEFPDLFDTRTWQDFIVVAQAMQQEGEELNQTFQRLLQQVQVTAAAMQQINAFADSSPLDDYLALVDAQQRTVFDAGRLAGDALRDALDNFDGSATAILEISQLTAQRYQLEMQMLSGIDQALAEVNSAFGSTIEQIQTDLRSEQENYEFFRQQAEALAAQLPSMTDPAQITRTLLEIERLTSRAYGFLGEDQRAAMGPEVVSFLEDVQRMGQEQLDKARDAIIEDSIALRREVEEMMAAVTDPLLLVAFEHGIAADSLQEGASALIGAARVFGENLGKFTSLVSTLRDIAGTSGQISVGPNQLVTTSSLQAQAQPAPQVVVLDASSVESVVLKSAQSTERALRSSVATAQVVNRSIMRAMDVREVGGSLV